MRLQYLFEIEVFLSSCTMLYGATSAKSKPSKHYMTGTAPTKPLQLVFSHHHDNKTLFFFFLSHIFLLLTFNSPFGRWARHAWQWLESRNLGMGQTAHNMKFCTCLPGNVPQTGVKVNLDLCKESYCQPIPLTTLLSCFLSGFSGISFAGTSIYSLPF